MKKNVFAKVISLGLIVLMGASLAGCAGSLKESDVSYAGPMLDNVLAGIKDNNYSEYSKDFDDTMKNAMPQDKFSQMVTQIQSQLGDYVSRTFEAAAPVTQDNVNYTKVVYKGKFSKTTKDVMITISFDEVNGQKKVAGIFFQ
jgi:hypothetical protein